MFLDNKHNSPKQSLNPPPPSSNRQYGYQPPMFFAPELRTVISLNTAEEIKLSTKPSENVINNIIYPQQNS
jgi:hypothetical protein